MKGIVFQDLLYIQKKNTNCIYPSSGCVYDYSIFKYRCFTKFNLTGNFWNDSSLDYWLVRDEKFEWILEYLKEYDPEYNLSMYELFGFNEEYVRKKY